MLAQAVTGTPGHVNAMAERLATSFAASGTQNMFEGDVYITNDPWEGTGHRARHNRGYAVISQRRKHVGFFACTAHIVDIGGRGFGADANSVYEEGLHIPIIKLADRGTVNDTLITIVRTNVREPDQVVGDIYALATCNEVGHRRLVDMMDEFGLEDLVAIADFILDNSRRATIERIAALPNATADGQMTIDGYSAPVELKVRLTVRDETHPG
jgi:N-methylhydantoinase B